PVNVRKLLLQRPLMGGWIEAAQFLKRSDPTHDRSPCWSFSFPILAYLSQLAAVRACSRSVIRSSTASTPTDSRSRSGGHGVVGPSTLARCSRRLSTPPSDVARFHSSTFAAVAMAA